MATVVITNCDGCKVEVDLKKDPASGWAGKLPLPSVPLTEQEKKEKKTREKYSIDHAILCKACKEKLGDFIQTLGG